MSPRERANHYVEASCPVTVEQIILKFNEYQRKQYPSQVQIRAASQITMSESYAMPVQVYHKVPGR